MRKVRLHAAQVEQEMANAAIFKDLFSFWLHLDFV